MLTAAQVETRDLRRAQRNRRKIVGHFAGAELLQSACPRDITMSRTCDNCGASADQLCPMISAQNPPALVPEPAPKDQVTALQMKRLRKKQRRAARAAEPGMI